VSAETTNILRFNRDRDV